MARPEFVWTGEYEEVEVADWWCPTEERWAMCSDPCPDGTPHGPVRLHKVRAKVMRPTQPYGTPVIDGGPDA